MTSESSFISLYDALCWIAFGHAEAPPDVRSVAAFDEAEQDLIRRLQIGEVSAVGKFGNDVEVREIAKLFWAEAEIDPVDNSARPLEYLKADSQWRDIRFYRHEILRIWPDPAELETLPSPNPPEPPPSRRVPLHELEAWYRDYYVPMKLEAREIPNRDEDLAAARGAHGGEVSRESLRNLRAEYAPQEWREKGRRKLQVSKPAKK
jgi:hypothetical protein